MSEVLKNAVLIFRGEKRVTDRERFRFLAVFMGTTHLILTGIGLLLLCLPLILFSAFSAAMEFLMIVFGNVTYALKVIDKVQRELKQADLSVDGKQIPVTMTFGISECGEVPGKDVDELIRRADRRLYIGKNSGKNCIKIKDE